MQLLPKVAGQLGMKTSLKSAIPKEIDDHLRLYSKEPWEVEFIEECGICGRKIDEFGLCGCDTGGGD